MTNIEAIRAKVAYPLEDNTFELALIDRGLNTTDEYLPVNRRALELAQADCLIVLISSASISEGSYRLSISDKAELRKTAQALYLKWGEPNPFESKVQDITDLW